MADAQAARRVRSLERLTARAAMVVSLVIGGALAGPATAGASEPSPPPEPRLSPLPPNHLFVQAAIADLAGRAATAADIARWLPPLESGVPRAEVASQLVDSRSHARQRVIQLYRRILDRDPDTTALQYWTERLYAGFSTSSLASRLYASAEFSPTGPNTETLFVNRLYEVALGRSASNTERSYWVGRLHRGETRINVARVVFLSRESNLLRVRGYYIQYLRRPPTPGPHNLWIDLLQRVDDIELVTRLVGSPEYFDRAQNPYVLEQHHFASGFDASISADGRFIAFASHLDTLTPGDVNRRHDVFLFDARTSRIRRLTSGNGNSDEAAISADGRVVAFSSDASDLVPGDLNAKRDVFRLRLDTGELRRLTNGTQSSREPTIDQTGTRIAFTSTARLVAGDDNDFDDVYLYRASGAPTLALLSRGSAPADHASDLPSISADGGTVAFKSSASNLVPEDTDDGTDVFLADVTGATSSLTALTDIPDPTFDPGGRVGIDGEGASVAIGIDDLTVVYDTAAGSSTSIQVPQHGLADVVMSDDGSTIAVEAIMPTVMDRFVTEIAVVDPATSSVRIIQPDFPDEPAPCCPIIIPMDLSGDGSILVTSGLAIVDLDP